MNKVELLHIIQSRISDRIENLEQLILDKRNSNNDTKSSMGDKYETGREMLQQEINNLQNQLNAFLLQKQSILSIKTDKCSKVEKGSLVETEKGSVIKKGGYDVVKFEADCTEKTLKMILFVAYDSTGNLKGKDTGPFFAEPVIPDTMSETLLESACNKIID